MKGSAPNCSKIGSQTEVRKKLKPNLCRGSTEPCHNSTTSRRVTRTTEAANKNVITLAISSPSRSRERNEREPATGPALGTVVVDVTTLVGQPALLNFVDGLQFLAHDFLGELRIRQAFCIVLPICQRPLEEALKGIPLRSIGKLLRNQ